MLARRRWIVIATLLTVVITTALVTWRMTPIYQGETRVEILPTTLGPATSSGRTGGFLDSTLQTQVALAESEEVMARAASLLKLPSTQDLRTALSVELLSDTEVLVIKVEHPRPDEARDWANALADAYLAFRRGSAAEATELQRDQVEGRIQEVQRRITEIDRESELNPSAAVALRAERDRALARLNILEEDLSEIPEGDAVRSIGGRVISRAVLPTEPLRPKKALNVALSIVAGTILGLGLALLAENLDDRLKTTEDVEDRVGAPVLGYIPLVKEWSESGRSKLAILSATTPGAAEAYRTLRANLRFVSLEKPLRTIMVTSPVANAGKSTTSANLAATLAQGGSKVVLVSADLRRPTIHKFFGLSNYRGVVDILDPDFPLGEAFQKCEIPNLRLLATGGLPPNPTEILGSERFAAILAQLREVADYVIMDAPPLLGLGDASAVASRVDGVLLVLRMGTLTKRELHHGVDQLRKAGGKIAGVVLNAVEAQEGFGYYYRNYYTEYREGNGGGNGETHRGRPDQVRGSAEQEPDPNI